jgi:hypothetical protein
LVQVAEILDYLKLEAIANQVLAGAFPGSDTTDLVFWSASIDIAFGLCFMLNQFSLQYPGENHV